LHENHPALFSTSGASLRASTTPARLFVCLFLLTSTCIVFAQTSPAKQANDEDYTKKIKEYLSDRRFTTELVDHLPASSKVPTPLKFLGSMPGQPGELYYTRTSTGITRSWQMIRREQSSGSSA
jgi:hypothetical protein